MRGWLLIPVMLFVFAACKGKNRIPSGVLRPKEMQAVLWDIMRADQFLANYVLNKDSSLNKETESLKYYEQIFTIHEITKEKFQKSFSFYKDHPDLLKVIMDSISRPPAEAPTTQVVEPPVSTVQQTTRPDTIRQVQKPIGLDTFTLQQKKKRLPLQ